ncbi:MAG: transcriptional regulator NrdR [Actinomycetota bacterium]|nr:transcriptional regulator NrdR [Actinomycetota bacterium]
MRCPWCGGTQTKVVDSRPADEGSAIRRRRECERCERRFTTFERSEAARLMVVKRDGTKEPYLREKLVSGVTKSLTNRPVSPDQVQRLAERVEAKLRTKGPAVTSQEVGLEVLGALRTLDQVAYLRFASVYKDFQEVTDFERELGLLLQKRRSRPAAAPRGSKRR